MALVLIPQSMAYAQIAGVPAYIGLFAGAIPPIVAALFASSPFLQTGPVALTSLMTFGALEGRAEPFTPEWVRLAALLALIVGVVRLLLGITRLGGVAYLMSQPVLTGFTTAAAILIAASQLPRALGVVPEDGRVLGQAFEALTSPGDWTGEAILLSAITLALMLGGRVASKWFPGVLLAVIVGVVFSRITNYTGETVGDLPGDFVSLTFNFEWGSAAGLLIPGAVIALVGFAEPASIARTFAAIDRTPWSADREMLGQGIANVASAVSGAFPVGGSFSRSSLNRFAGAKTAWSGAITGIVVLATLPLSPVLEPLPRAVLAAIVLGAIVKLIRIDLLVKIWSQSATQAMVGAGTAIATLLASPQVERGLLVGIGLSIATHLYREIQIVYRMKVTGETNHVLRIEPRGVVWFGSTPNLERTLAQTLAANPQVTEVVIDVAGVGRIDYTGAVAFKRLIDDAEAAGLEVRIEHMSNNAHRALGVLLEGTHGVPQLDHSDESALTTKLKKLFAEKEGDLPSRRS